MKISLVTTTRIAHANGFELAFAHDDYQHRTITQMTVDGEMRTIKKEVAESLLQASDLEYCMFDHGRCLLIVNVAAEKVYRFFFDHTNFELAVELRRTDYTDEGFDCCFFHDELESVGLAFLCHEYGLHCFDRRGKIVWSQAFGEMMSIPVFEQEAIRYDENSYTVRYAKINGALLTENSN